MRFDRALIRASLFLLVLSTSAAAQEATLVVENARVIVGDGSVLSRASVVVSGERILRLTTEAVEAPGVRRIDAGGRTVMPGLVDAHVHLTIGSEVTDSSSLEAYLEDELPGVLREFLRAGVTTVRSTGDYWPWIGEIRDRIARGELEGPRILTSGPVFTYDGGHPAATVCQGGAFCRSRMAAEVENPDEARRMVSRVAEEGVDFIKLVSDSMLVPVQIPAAVESAIITQAHREGLDVVGHVAEAPFIERAAEAGIDGFVHPPGSGPGVPPLVGGDARELARALVREGTPVTTTIAAALVYDPVAAERTFQSDSAYRAGAETYVRGLTLLAEEGVQVAVGTDWCSCGPGVFQSPHDAVQAGSVTVTEVEMLAWGGMSPSNVLQAATVNGARALGLGHDLGTLEVGRIADLIVVDGDPLENPSALRNVEVVVQGGEVVVPN